MDRSAALLRSGEQNDAVRAGWRAGRQYGAQREEKLREALRRIERMCAFADEGAMLTSRSIREAANDVARGALAEFEEDNNVDD